MLGTISGRSLPPLLSTKAPSAQTLVPFCTNCCVCWPYTMLDGYTAPPCPRHRLTGCQDDPPWSGFSRNKSWKPLSHKKLFSILIIYHRYHKPGENVTTFFSLRVRKTSSQGQRCRNIYIGFSHSVILPPPSQLSQR